jgi:hypothetical protein
MGGQRRGGRAQAGQARLHAEEKNANLQQLEEEMTSLALRGASLQLGSGEGGASTSQPAAAAADTLHDDKNRLLCVVCMEVEKSVTLLPCSHLCMCVACTEIIMASTKQCPVCRAPVATTQRFFM